MTEPYPPNTPPAHVPAKPLPSWGSIMALSKYVGIGLAVLVLGGALGYSVVRKGYMPKLTLPAVDAPKEVTLEALLQDYRDLTRMSAYSADSNQRKALRTQIDVIVAKIRARIDVMPEKDIPPEALRFRLTR